MNSREERSEAHAQKDGRGFCKPRNRTQPRLAKKIKKKIGRACKGRPSALRKGFSQQEFEKGLGVLLGKARGRSEERASSQEASSIKSAELKVVLRTGPAPLPLPSSHVLKEEDGIDWSRRGSELSSINEDARADFLESSDRLFEGLSSVKMELPEGLKEEDISIVSGACSGGRLESAPASAQKKAPGKCGIDWARVKQIGVSNIRSMIKQSRFSSLSDAPLRSSEIKHEQTSLSWILKQKEQRRQLAKTTFKYGETKQELSGTAKKKIVAIMKYIQKNVLKADYYLRKYNRIKDKLSLRGSLMNLGGSTNCSFLSLLLMTEADYPFEIGKLNLEKTIKHNWIKQKNKLEGTFNQESLKKSKYMMYEDYVILKVMELPGKRKQKVALLSEYLQRTQLSITDHLKILNRAMRESDIRSWFFPLVENHLGQYSEWIRINYKSLLPDPFQRNDGGVIRFSFHVDWWLLFCKIKNGDSTFEASPEAHLQNVCFKLYNREVDCADLIHRMHDYFDLLLKFEQYLKILRSAKDEQIYLDANARTGASIYSYEELYPLLTPEAAPEAQRQGSGRDEEPKPVLETREVQEEFNLKTKLDKVMRIKKHNRKGIHILVFEYSDRLLAKARLGNSSLKLNAQEKMFLCWLVAYSLGRMTEEYRQHLRALLCEPVEDREVFLSRISSILVILDKVKSELTMRDQQIRIEDIRGKIKKIRALFFTKLKGSTNPYSVAGARRGLE